MKHLWVLAVLALSLSFSGSLYASSCCSFNNQIKKEKGTSGVTKLKTDISKDIASVKDDAATEGKQIAASDVE